jgi:hypothetical protein
MNDGRPAPDHYRHEFEDGQGQAERFREPSSVRGPQRGPNDLNTGCEYFGCLVAQPT